MKNKKNIIKLAIVKFDEKWLKENAEKYGDSPIKVFADEVDDTIGLLLYKSKGNKVVVAFDPNAERDESIIITIFRVFVKVFENVSPENVIETFIEDSSARESKDLFTALSAHNRVLALQHEGEQDDEDVLDEVLSKVQTDLNEHRAPRDEFDACFTPSENKSEENEETDVDGLVGAEEFKALIKEIKKMAPIVKEKNICNVLTDRCYLFSIGSGCGYTTDLYILAETITNANICKMNTEHPVREEVFTEDDDQIFTVEGGDSSEVKVLSIDISKALLKTDSVKFKALLRAIEKNIDNYIYVFRVPFLEKSMLEKVRASIADVLSVKVVSVPPLTTEEMRNYASTEFNDMGYTVNDDAWIYFDERISEEQADGRFYGLNTIAKIVKEAVYEKILIESEQGVDDTVINADNMKAICVNTELTTISAEDQLREMIGTESITEKLHEIVAQIEMSMKTDLIDRPCFHMQFTGNPGTGKTTVARIIGKMLKEKGVLRVGNFYECSRRDLCGKYIGETAPKTSAVCRNALGSVLFIDEAYSLYRGETDGKDFGLEALETLVAEMENHKDDLVVIFAGYKDDMARLMEGNQGLKSRIPYTIEFPNYTNKQLYEIFVYMVNKKSICDDQCLETARKYFDSIPSSVLNEKSFSNARFVRNLFERAECKAAMRCQLNKISDIVITKDDFERAVASEDAFNFTKNNIKPKIGF